MEDVKNQSPSLKTVLEISYLVSSAGIAGCIGGLVARTFGNGPLYVSGSLLAGGICGISASLIFCVTLACFENIDCFICKPLVNRKLSKDIEFLIFIFKFLLSIIISILVTTILGTSFIYLSELSCSSLSIAVSSLFGSIGPFLLPILILVINCCKIRKEIKQ